MLGVVGRYRLDAPLGAGGMAEVFAGSLVGAEGFARPVAIKRILPAYSRNPSFAQMFVAEAQLSARLSHPNIVSVFDFDRDADQRLFLVMELVAGRDLHTLLQTGILPIPVVSYVIVEALRGLGYAHELHLGELHQGLIHRDVSPHNVLLSWEGEVKVSDFGLAKTRDATQATATELVKGKPAYMSPEQANGQPLDGRSDLFSVGVIMWEMLTGRRLFNSDDMRATLAAVLFGTIPRPRQLRHDIPRDVERVVMKLLEREPSARYQTASEAIADLLVCADAGGGGRDGLVMTLVERFLVQPRPLPPSHDGPAVRRGRRVLRARWWLAPTLIGIIMIVILGLRAIMQRSSSARFANGEPSSSQIALVDDSVQPKTRPLVDPRELPHGCAIYVELLQTYSVCPVASQAVRDHWAQELQRLREGLAGINGVRDTTSLENECVLQYNDLLTVDVGC